MTNTKSNPIRADEGFRMAYRIITPKAPKMLHTI